jgi:uncharacterized protein (TIGR02271 family)
VADAENSANSQEGGIETLPDGSLSIPILEEELVIGKRQVVRERVVVRKRTEIETEHVEEELAFERLEIDADEDLLADDGESPPNETTLLALPTVDDLPMLRNIPVIDADGAELGRIGDAYYDERDRRLRMVGVARDALGFKRLLVPLTGAVIAEDGLHVRQTKAELERIPDSPEAVAEGLESEAATGELVRHEERLAIGTRTRQLGTVRARKRIEARRARESVERAIEHFEDVERVQPNDDDSGQIETRPDGSLSIPIFEEQLVVTKRPVIRERVLIRKVGETDRYRIAATLRREEVGVEVNETESSGGGRE